MPHPHAVVGVSSIAGHGLFSTTDLAASVPVVSADGLTALNHSCDPTLGWSGSDGLVDGLVTLRPIPKGTELTYDYATVVDDPEFLLRCHCETYRCRQLIEGTDWQIPQLQQRYRGHWAPHVQARIDAASAGVGS